MIDEVAWLWPDASKVPPALDEKSAATLRKQPLKLLRQIAEERKVDLRGCLDKEEVLERLELDQRRKDAISVCADAAQACKIAHLFRLGLDSAIRAAYVDTAENLLQRAPFNMETVKMLADLEASSAQVLSTWKAELSDPEKVRKQGMSDAYQRDRINETLQEISRSGHVNMQKYQSDSQYAGSVLKEMRLPADG
eukprot:TRINITY_DN10110_c0_g1_i1.p2 TRINITY_DN10110_c0_g1~~TRINITY_DN10110_c0_g1_i1.p2  ORF type:complete len:195 (+),score=59.73 TRINITY_DN10110_c0_g1_i1:521-1105(+)